MSEGLAFQCFHCRNNLVMGIVGRQDSCPKCGRDLKVCCNCINYDPSFNNSCRESQADRVVEKEKSNFCDWFKAGKNKLSGGVAVGGDSLKNAAEALFKKK